jgi:hypothetical protein
MAGRALEHTGFGRAQMRWAADGGPAGATMMARRFELWAREHGAYRGVDDGVYGSTVGSRCVHVLGRR